VSVIDEEVKSIKHVSIILKDGNLQSLLNDLLDLGFSFLPILNELNTFLLVSLFQEITRILNKFIRKFNVFLNILHLG